MSYKEGDVLSSAEARLINVELGILATYREDAERLNEVRELAAQLAERDARIRELEAELRIAWEADPRVAELERERQITADWADQNLSDMQVYEYRQALLAALPPRLEHSDDDACDGETKAVAE